MVSSLFDAFVRTSQYLAMMPADKNAFLESPAVMTRFFDADVAFLITTQKKGAIALSHLCGFAPVTTQELLDAFGKSAQEVMQIGYFDILEKVFGDKEYGFILLPLELDNVTNAVLIAGFVDVSEFSKDALNVYLAVCGLICSTYQKQRNESKNKMILENAGEGIFGLDRDGRHTFVNEAAARMLGFGVQELLGRNSHATWHHHKADGQEYDEHECPVFHLLNGQVEQTKGEEYFLRKDKSGFEVEFVATPIKEADETTGVVVIFRDITLRKRLERELLQINSQLEERVKQEVSTRQKQELLLMQQSRLAAMGEMIGAIAHQWRQPLNALGLRIQDLKDAYDYGEFTREYLEETVAKSMGNIAFMSQTIDDFRNFFRVDASHELFNVCRVIEDTIGLVDSMFKNNNIEVHRVCDDSMQSAFVDGNMGEMKQVVLNLLSNAKDAILQQKEREGRGFFGYLDITVDMDEDTIFIHFADNGGGIPEDVLERIFDPYFTTKEQGKGTGIGLYMAKIITEEHFGGRLKVQNGDSGAVFTIELKRAICHSELDSE